MDMRCNNLYIIYRFITTATIVNMFLKVDRNKHLPNSVVQKLFVMSCAIPKVDISCMLWINPGRQLIPSQLFAHSPTMGLGRESEG